MKLLLCTQAAGSMGIAQLKCQECCAVVTSAEEQLCSSDGEQLPGKGSGDREALESMGLG